MEDLGDNGYMLQQFENPANVSVVMHESCKGIRYSDLVISHGRV